MKWSRRTVKRIAWTFASLLFLCGALVVSFVVWDWTYIWRMSKHPVNSIRSPSTWLSMSPPSIAFRIFFAGILITVALTRLDVGHFAGITKLTRATSWPNSFADGNGKLGR